MAVFGCLALALVACAAASIAAPLPTLNASVVNGTLSYPGHAPTVIGNTTSALNAAIATVFGPVQPPPARDTAVLINSTVGVLSYLTLTGSYLADVPLDLPPQFVLAMVDATIVASPAFSGAALVFANGSAYSAVVSAGGPEHALIDCSAAPVGCPGVFALNSAFFLLDGVTVNACGISGPPNTQTAGVHLQGHPFVTGGEVANCVVRGGSRAIWTETISGALIHGNQVSAHATNSVQTALLLVEPPCLSCVAGVQQHQACD